MKKAYLITYDLKQPGRDYTALHEAIKKLGPWWHYLESVWIVLSESPPNDIWNRINKIDTNDRLLIIEVRDNVAGWLPKDAWEWIRANVPNP